MLLDEDGKKGKQMDHPLLNDIPVDESYGGYSYDTDGGADTAFTVASSTHDYRYENGRRYHAYRDGTHLFPNDDQQAEHERIAHHLWLLLFGDKLYLAPIEHPKKVIDMGTGLGLWASDMAEVHEEASVLGVDLTPVPQEALAPNLQFRVDDVTEDFTPDEMYDFVHIRGLFGAIKDWPRLYKQCFDHMSPGGYIQQTEIEIDPKCDDDTFAPDSAIRTFAKLAREFDQHFGSDSRNFMVSSHMGQRMRDAGFVDVVEKRFKLPLGPWSSDPKYREIGKWFELFWKSGSQGWIMAPLTRFMGKTPEEVNEICYKACKAVDERKEHVYYHAVVIYARRP